VVEIEGSTFNSNSFIFNANGVAPDNFIVIFNVKGESITFANCDFSSLDGYANRVIWNMPDVNTIRSSVDTIYGSIVAPKAYFTAEKGTIQGQIIVKNLNGPLEVEWVPFDGCIPVDSPDVIIDPVIEPDSDIEDEQINSEPESEPENYDLNGQCSSDNPLGVVSNFGAFTFGDFTGMGSDVQGRVGCKGKLSVTGYAINQEVYGTGNNNRFKCNEGPLKDDFQYAIVAGTLSIQNSGVSNGGIIYGDNDDDVVDYIKNNVINDGCKYHNDPSISDFFDKQENNMIDLSKKLGKLEDTNSVNIKNFYKL